MEGGGVCAAKGEKGQTSHLPVGYGEKYSLTAILLCKADGSPKLEAAVKSITGFLDGLTGNEGEQVLI